MMIHKIKIKVVYYPQIGKSRIFTSGVVNKSASSLSSQSSANDGGLASKQGSIYQLQAEREA